MEVEKVTDPDAIRVGDRFVMDKHLGLPDDPKVYVVHGILDGHVLWQGVPISRPAPVDLVLKHMSRIQP